MYDQDKYCFPYYKDWSQYSRLEKEINNLPMFFVTNNHGVNFLIENYGMNYYELKNSDSDWHMIRNNGKNKFSYMFSDGYEPEDNNLCREWLFLCVQFESIYKEGYEKGKNHE